MRFFMGCVFESTRSAAVGFSATATADTPLPVWLALGRLGMGRHDANGKVM
jgi:hypothetical protein